MVSDDEIRDPLEREALCKLCAILNELDAEAKERLLAWAAWPLEMDKPLRQLRPLSNLRGIVEELLRLRDENTAMKSACNLAYHHLDGYGYRAHEDQIKSQDAVFAALQPFADFAGRL